MGLHANAQATPGQPGNHDQNPDGIVSIRTFDPGRFGGSDAVTELFSVLAAAPTYQDLTPSDIEATVRRGGQRIRIFDSSAQSDAVEPLKPDLSSEIPQVEVALASFVNGGTGITITGSLPDLNPDPSTRDAFARVVAVFEYDSAEEAALGPFLEIDKVTIPLTFN